MKISFSFIEAGSFLIPCFDFIATMDYHSNNYLSNAHWSSE